MIDPGEAAYDGEAWAGERDFEAERAAAQGTRRRDGDTQAERGQRALRRSVERQKRARAVHDERAERGGAAVRARSDSGSEAGPSSSGSSEQVGRAVGEEEDIAVGTSRAGGKRKVKTEAKPRGSVQKGKSNAKYKLRTLLKGMAVASVRAGRYLEWPVRTVYAKAAAIQVQPARLVRDLLGQLSNENVVMVVDDEVHYIGADVNPDREPDQVDEADMLNTGTPLRDGPGELEGEGGIERGGRVGRGQKRKAADYEQVGD